jgi:hypothetical protein
MSVFIFHVDAQIGTEHWFLLSEDGDRLEALKDHMACVDACFHTPDYATRHHRNHLHDHPTHHHPNRRHHHRQEWKSGQLQQQQQQQQQEIPPRTSNYDDAGYDPAAASGGADDDDSLSSFSEGLGMNGQPFHYTLSLAPIAARAPFPGDPAHYSPATHGPPPPPPDSSSWQGHQRPASYSSESNLLWHETRSEEEEEEADSNGDGDDRGESLHGGRVSWTGV